MTQKMDMEFIKFEYPWHIPENSFRQLIESSKIISRRIWTTHKNAVLEWRVEYSPSMLGSNAVDFGVTYIDGPLKRVRFRCSIVRVYASGKFSDQYLKVGGNESILSVERGEKRTLQNFANFNPFGTQSFFRQIRFEIAFASFSLDIPSEPQGWVVGFGNDYHEHIENPNPKHSDIRLISGDKHTFYCHRIALIAQSEAMEAMFRNARTEEEKNGTFRLSAWTTEELRKILEYFYTNKPDLKSSSIQQLMNIFHFAEQYGLDRLKKFVRAQLWNHAAQYPMDCAEIARFADLHASTGLNPLKYHCYDLLAQNYVPLGVNGDDIFKDAQQDTPDVDGEPPSKKMRSSGDVDSKEKDDVGTRLKNELMEYLCGRVEGVMMLEGKSHA